MGLWSNIKVIIHDWAWERSGWPKSDQGYEDWSSRWCCCGGGCCGCCCRGCCLKINCYNLGFSLDWNFSSDFSFSMMTLIFCSPPCQVPKWPCCRWRCRPSPRATPPRSPGQKMSKQGTSLTFKGTVRLRIVFVFLLPTFIHFVHLVWNRAVWSFTFIGGQKVPK